MLPNVVTREEIARKGEAIYEQTLRPALEPKHTGQYLFINVETGEWEVDADQVAAAQRAATRFPGALLYGLKIGFPSVARIGVRSRVFVS